MEIPETYGNIINSLHPKSCGLVHPDIPRPPRDMKVVRVHKLRSFSNDLGVIRNQSKGWSSFSSKSIQSIQVGCKLLQSENLFGKNESSQVKSFVQSPKVASETKRRLRAEGDKTSSKAPQQLQDETRQHGDSVASRLSHGTELRCYRGVGVPVVPQLRVSSQDGLKMEYLENREKSRQANRKGMIICKMMAKSNLTKGRK